MNNFEFDMKKSFEESMDFQKKMISGFENLINLEDPSIGASEKELVYSEDKLKLYRYKALTKNSLKTPLLVVYALVNKETILDLEENNSFVRNLLNEGIDVYIIDWGYPTIEDKFITLTDYIDGYLNNCVDAIREQSKQDKVNLLGVCQGGTFSTIYSSLYPDKVKNLVTLVAPIDFAPNDALLFAWSKNLDIDAIVAAHNGLVPGDFMNSSFVTLKPIALNVNKYLGFVDTYEDPTAIENFLRMEKWIFDSPAQAGATLTQFVKDLYQGNKLIKGELVIGDKVVNLKNLKMPILNLYGSKDHIVSPEASRNFKDYAGSKDFEDMEVPTGHIGMFVSSRSKKVVAPKIAEWLKARK